MVLYNRRTRDSSENSLSLLVGYSAGKGFDLLVTKSEILIALIVLNRHV